ncbi:hypothetical protein Mal52_18980 [Symmachiella dynata]|uniref:Uncharacterized protein n=1 Tax=Symmachiella dynata TaxID=2527995 RepID=A0A517ZLR6_9PLAN|nr:hypothetical protein [Symmachiella dynata]QDU43424.1 hypothetical protein Mal52_18980 [Symmachiella dynata]
MPVESVQVTGGFGDMMVFFVFVVGVLTFIVNFSFAAGVFRNAEYLFKAERLNFVGPWMWFFATLFGGVFVAAVYWAVHHSRLNPVISLGEMSQVQDPE